MLYELLRCVKALSTSEVRLDLILWEWVLTEGRQNRIASRFPKTLQTALCPSLLRKEARRPSFTPDYRRALAPALRPLPFCPIAIAGQQPPHLSPFRYPARYDWGV
jgi:hypothetical protein